MGTNYGAAVVTAVVALTAAGCVRTDSSGGNDVARHEAAEGYHMPAPPGALASTPVWAPGVLVESGSMGRFGTSTNVSLGAFQANACYTVVGAGQHAHCGQGIEIQVGKEYSIELSVGAGIGSGDNSIDIGFSSGLTYTSSVSVEVPGQPCNCCYAQICTDVDIRPWKIGHAWGGASTTKVIVTRVNPESAAFGLPQCKPNPDCPNCSDGGVDAGPRVTGGDAGTSGTQGLPVGRAGSTATQSGSGTSGATLGSFDAEKESGLQLLPGALQSAQTATARATVDLASAQYANLVPGTVVGHSLATTNGMGKCFLEGAALTVAEAQGVALSSIFVAQPDGQLVELPFGNCEN